MAVLVSPERYEEFLEALEEADDVGVFDTALAEAGPNISWDEVTADLGRPWVPIASRCTLSPREAAVRVQPVEATSTQRVPL